MKKEASNLLVKRNAKPVCLKERWRRAQGKEKRGSLLSRQREDQSHPWKEPRIRAPESGGVHPRMRRFVLCMSASARGLGSWTWGLTGTLTNRPAGRISSVSLFLSFSMLLLLDHLAAWYPWQAYCWFFLWFLPVSYCEWLCSYLWEGFESCIRRLHLSSCHPSSSVCVGRISTEIQVFIWLLTSISSASYDQVISWVAQLQPQYSQRVRYP